MVLQAPREEEGVAWLKIMENIMMVSSVERLELVTNGEWRAAVCRCVLLILQAPCTLLIRVSIICFNLTCVDSRISPIAMLPGNIVSHCPEA